MSLRLHPDPQHPAGGYGFCELPGDTLPESVMVSVQDAYSQRWLHPGDGPEGDANWQSARHDFGPYRVFRHDGADWVRFGPEIADRIEEYTPLRLEIDGRCHDAIWPDTLLRRIPAATRGKVQRATEVVADAPLPDRRAPPERAEPDFKAEISASTRPEQPGRRTAMWPVLVLLFLGAGAAAWYLASDAPGVALDGESDAEPVADRAGCSLTALRDLEVFSRQLEAIRACGRSVSPDTALRMIEDAAGNGNADALLLFGTLYDGDELAPRIENLIGLSFADDPARAVEYYTRAARAGSAEAEARAVVTCARLDGSTLTLERGAFDDFCR